MSGRARALAPNSIFGDHGAGRFIRMRHFVRLADAVRHVRSKGATVLGVRFFF